MARGRASTMYFSVIVVLALSTGLAEAVGRAGGPNSGVGHHPPGVGHRTPPPRAPAPPPLPRPNVGPINTLDDVCQVCTREAYAPDCYGPMASSCLRAMWIYRYRVLKVKENLCDCYGTIAGQLLQFCDGADINLAYLSRCDFTCNYGTVCPFQTTVFALLGESHVVPDDATAVSAPAPAPASSSESETGDPAAGAAATPPPASSPSPSPSTSAALPGLSAAYPGPTPAGTAATSAGSTGGAAAPAPAIPASRKLLALSADIGISVADDGVAYAAKDESDPSEEYSGYSAVAIINFVGGINESTQICYEVKAGVNLKHITAGRIYRGDMGRPGLPAVTLFGERNAKSKACVDTPLPLIRQISANPIGYYFQLATRERPEGHVRGQLVIKPTLFSQLSSDQVTGGEEGKGPNCDGARCRGYAELEVSPSSIKYHLEASRSVGSLVSAEIGSDSSRLAGDAFLPLFGNGYGPARLDDGTLAPVKAVRALLANPPGFYLRAANSKNPGGIIQGHFTDTLQVKSLLKAEYELDEPTGVTGTGLMTATLGGGGICFSFKFEAGVGTPTEAHIHEGKHDGRGAIVVILFGLGTPAVDSGCVPVDTDVTATILRNPSSHYIQVYTEENPIGAVRGQLTLSN